MVIGLLPKCINFIELCTAPDGSDTPSYLFVNVFVAFIKRPEEALRQALQILINEGGVKRTAGKAAK